MLPILALSLGGSLLGGGLLLAALYAVLRVLAYDVAGDAYAHLHSTTQFLKTPTDGLERLVLDFTPDDEYPAGGYSSLGNALNSTGSLAALKLESIVFVEGFSPAGYVCAWDRANSKLKVFRQTDPAAAGGADIPLVEVAAATNLSAIEFTLKVYGVRSYAN